jgi:hypothetical protein
VIHLPEILSGNSSSLIVAAASGILSPIPLLIASLLLFLFKPVLLELDSAKETTMLTSSNFQASL